MGGWLAPADMHVYYIVRLYYLSYRIQVADSTRDSSHELALSRRRMAS